MSVCVQEGRRQVDPQAPEAALLETLEYAFGLRHTEPEEGARIALEIGDLTETRRLPHVEAVTAVVWAYSADIADAPEDGLLRLQDAVDVCGHFGDRQNQVRAADLLSTIFEGIGDYPAALNYAEIALEGARAIGDRLFEVCALSSLAGIFTATGDLEIAEKKARMSLELALRGESKRIQARAYFRLGCIHRRAGRLKEAEQFLEQSGALGREVGSRFVQAESYTELGRLYEEQERFDKAEFVLLKAVEVADSDVVEVVIPATNVALARVYVRTDRPVLAKQCLSGLGEKKSLFNLYPVLADGTRLLAEVHDALGEEREALEQYRRHVRFREKAMEAEAQRAVNRHKVKIKLAVAEREAEQQRARYRELETIQTQLVEAERRAAVGNLAAGLAHEMNTPLGALRSSLNTLQRAQARMRDILGEDVDPKFYAALSVMHETQTTMAQAHRRLESLIGDLRRFTRLDEADVQAVDLNECVDAALSLLAPSLCKGLCMERALATLPRITGWPGRINQALLTLLVNAAEVQRGSGRIRVESAAVDDACVVRVIDDGPGIPASARESLFELAFDTSGPRARFRVGLAAVRSVMVDHGGTIDFQTGASGTTFTLTFPTGRMVVAPA